MTHTHTGADTYKELYTWLLRAPLFPRLRVVLAPRLLKVKTFYLSARDGSFYYAAFSFKSESQLRPTCVVLLPFFFFSPPSTLFPFLFFFYLPPHRFEYLRAQSASHAAAPQAPSGDEFNVSEPGLQTRLGNIAKRRRRRKHAS